MTPNMIRLQSRKSGLTKCSPLTAGRWQGALVAIKIVEYTLKGPTAEADAARESLLAASISHPNVVRSTN